MNVFDFGRQASRQAKLGVRGCVLLSTLSLGIQMLYPQTPSVVFGCFIVAALSLVGAVVIVAASRPRQGK